MDTGKAHPSGRGARWAAWALAAAVAWPGAAPAAERVALVIGNAAYVHTDALRNPGNDADAMAAALRRLGFEVVLGKDLDTDGFYDTLGAFDEASRGADVTLFFYAGHGLQVRGRNWLAPVDAKLESRLDLERGAVELDTVLEHMRGTKKLVFLDACRNNPLAGDLARTLGLSRTAATQRGLARVQSGSGTLIGYATAPDDVAADGAGRNSPFTEALLAHIETPGLSVNDMFGDVSEAVSRATGGKQVPWSHSSLGRFYLASAAVAPSPKVTPTPAAGGTSTVQTPPPSGDAARAYEAAERLNTVAGYRAFIRRFPGSYEADLARGHIAKLEGAKEPLVVAGGGDVDETAPPPKPSPEAVEQGLGLDREERRLVQMGLAAAGHSPGSADGLFGGKTRRALQAWQASKEVEATGYLTKEQGEVLAALGREEAQRLRVAAEQRAREEAERREREAREAEERRRAEAERQRKAKEAEARRRAEAERKAEERRRAEARKRQPGYKFRDCPECPEMVVVPAGRFQMGSTSGDSDERPVHPVTIARPFAVGVYEVTFGEWDACVSGDGCGGYWPHDEGWGRGKRPVLNVSWNDAQAYVRWLSRETGEAYRLLSEAEWEYVARAGTTTRYWWGNDIGRSRASCRGCGSRWDGKQTAPVGSFLASPFGLYDVHGNVWEWVEDCWNVSYAGAPRDGSAWTSGDCGQRVLRGASWNGYPRYLRSANRLRNTTDYRYYFFGFRVARTLTP